MSGRSERPESCLDVHETGDDRSLGVVCRQRIAEPLAGDAEPLGPTDAVLDADPEAAERPVVLFLLAGQFAAFRPLVGEVEVGVLLVIALVRAVDVARLALSIRSRAE